MKKTFALLLSAIMLFALFASISFAADDADFAVNISAPKSVSLRESFTVSVSVDDIAKNKGGLSSIEFEVHFHPVYAIYLENSATIISQPSLWDVRIDASDVKHGIIVFSAKASSYVTSGVKESGELKFSFGLESLSGMGGASLIWCDEIKAASFGSSPASLNGTSNPITLIISSQKRDIPDTPELLGKSATTVYLLSLGDGYEYSHDLTHWQKSPTFTGLIPGRTYRFYARAAATDTLAASDASLPLEVTLPQAQTETSTSKKDGYENPIEIADVTSNSVSIKPVENRQYSIDLGKTWHDEGVFENLLPDEMYVIFAREKSTKKMIANISFRTLKRGEGVPLTPMLSSKTGDTVTLVGFSNCEYSMDKINWQDSPVFNGLSEGTEYTFYAKYKNSDGISEGLKVKTAIPSCTHTNTREERVESTCAKAGSVTVICVNCGEVVSTGALPLSEHKTDTRMSVASTCTSEGTNETYCTVCGKVLSVAKLPKLDHERMEIIIKQATKKEDGASEVRCRVCGELLETLVLEKTGKTPTPEKQRSGKGLLTLVIILVVVVVLASIAVVIWILSKGRRRQQKHIHQFIPRFMRK